jgi:hypothetical protein
MRELKINVDLYATKTDANRYICLDLVEKELMNLLFKAIANV